MRRRAQEVQRFALVGRILGDRLIFLGCYNSDLRSMLMKRNFATFCDTSLSFANFYDMSQNRKDVSQNRKDMSQVAKDTSQNSKDTSQIFATFQNVLAIFCDIV